MLKKILIIDDEPELLQFLKMRLEANQYEVISATDGIEGLEKLKQEKPDLILLDIIMPNMDGYTFVQEIRKCAETKTIPVIVLTAKDKMQELFRVEGVNDYIVKPFDKENLLAKVQKHLGDMKERLEGEPDVQ